MSPPIISVITPSFNQASFLEETIQSVLDNKYPKIEYIIIDGGSIDGSVDIIRRYEKYLTYWESKPDRGQSHAINKGLKYCSGEIFNWLNSDDYYYPDALNRVVEGFFTNRNAMVVGGRERAFLSENGNTSTIHEGTNIKEPVEQLIYQGIIDQPSTFWRMDILKILGPLPEQLHYTMDSYWWTKFLLLYGKTHVTKIPEMLTNFRLHKNSKSISHQEKFNTERVAIRKELASALRFDKRITDFLTESTNISIKGFFDDCIYIDQQKKERLESNFARQIYPKYYMKHDYESARILFKLYNKEAELNLKYFIDLIRIILIPKSISEYIRRVKSFYRSYNRF
jgi:glycosyltransferase involved in cell wall biosynthesis